MSKRHTLLRRREFLKHSAAGAAFCLAAPNVIHGSPNERLNIAGIGVGGKGRGDIAATAVHNNVVALCDVDDRTLADAAKKYPDAKTYHDWRKLLEQKDIDAVTISTPDHMHAPIALAAMQLGKHVYVQKPMAHTVREARAMTEAAKKQGVVSQTGNQHHSGAGYRTLVKLIRDGVIGKVREAHAWSDRPIWPQGIGRPKGADPVPQHLHWDLWLGVAPERPYVGPRGKQRRGRGAYHPFNWRGWLDFGVGALGDMGCHIIDPVVWSLELGPPRVLWYDGAPTNGETFPKTERIHYEFAATSQTAGPIQVTWHDGGAKPDRSKIPLPEPSAEAKQDKKRSDPFPSNGTLFIGEKGVVLCPHGGFPQLLPASDFADVEVEKVEGDNHYQQWANACKGQGETTSTFDYSGPLTETVLLGTVAMHMPGEKLEWDSEQMAFRQNAGANAFLDKEYRSGWAPVV